MFKQTRKQLSVVLTRKGRYRIPREDTQISVYAHDIPVFRRADNFIYRKPLHTFSIKMYISLFRNFCRWFCITSGPLLLDGCKPSVLLQAARCYWMVVSHLSYYKRPVATGWLQAICLINVYICKRKVSNYSCTFQIAAIR